MTIIRYDVVNPCNQKFCLFEFLVNILVSPIKQEYVDLEDGAYSWSDTRGILISEFPIWHPPKNCPTTADKWEQLGRMSN